jgi:Ca2+/H+ antiporter, TMEM165/GDT1 family
MDALVTAFVTAALAEWGDKTQLIVALLAARSGRPATVMLGLIIAAAVSSAAVAVAAGLVAGMITIRAMSLMVALALLFAGIAGLIRRQPPSIGSARTPLILAAPLLCLAAELGLQAALPVRAVRVGGAILFLLAGFYVAVSALRLT